ncbi:MAG: hypothetical protein ABJO67_17540 [Pseudoruegeria sp.]
MQFSNRQAVCASSAVLFFLVACSESQVTRRGNFQSDYLVARQALETGNYSKASRHYKGLMPESGPLTTRIELEYAHSLLRDEDFTGAAQTARGIAATQSGTARAAALAVQGTAEHELGLAIMNTAPGDPSAFAYLRSASGALGEAIADSGDLDPLGALKVRKDSIDGVLARAG